MTLQFIKIYLDPSKAPAAANELLEAELPSMKGFNMSKAACEAAGEAHLSI